MSVRTMLIALVSVVWAVNIVATIVSRTYEPDPSINAVFSAVIGAIFATSKVGK